MYSLRYVFPHFRRSIFFRVHDTHRSGILQIIATRNSKILTPNKEVEFKCVTFVQMTPILVLLTTVALIAMLLIETDITVLGKTSI